MTALRQPEFIKNIVIREEPFVEQTDGGEEKGVRILSIVAALGTLMFGTVAAAATPSVPSGYPRSYSRTIASALREGQLSIWSVTDTERMNRLLKDFRRLYPGIRVEYRDMPANTLYHQFVKDAQRGQGSADLLWSSAMDLQIKLVNDGYAQAYSSPEKPHLPEWAVWKNEAWGVTAEPIVFAYNRHLMKAFGKVPGTHPDLLRFLTRNSERFRGQIATYDPAASAVGYLYLSQDQQASHNTWDLVRAMAKADVQLYPRTEDILKKLAQGRHAFAYNMIGSYALEAQARNPQIGVAVPRDYTLIMTRIAMIPGRARHPNAAKLFLDYLLSRRGQSILAAGYLTPVRRDVRLPPQLRLRGGPGRAIRVGPALLVTQDKLTRARFLREWRRALAGQ